ncbi:glycoside hydrolase family 36 protein [Cellulomonas sp. P22]|uniref:glycoside hydrolase family 36 protein n=1 Tax=Cellulomonas sp. P22 TaxID=3373189 RepID=UPI0037A2FAC1
MNRTMLHWGTGVLDVVLVSDDDAPVRLARLEPGSGTDAEPTLVPAQPLVEVFALGHGHAHANLRHTASAIGERLRYVTHSTVREAGWQRLDVEQVDPLTGLRVRSTLRAPDGVAAVQAWTEVVNEGTAPVVLLAVTSFATGAFSADGDRIDDVDLLTAYGDWLGESRWERVPVRSQRGLVQLALPSHQNQDARGALAVTSRSTWSSGERIPTGVLENRATGSAWAWQVEHNGAWHAELGERLRDSSGELAFLLMGPCDTEHQWTQPLAPGESFTTVPVSVAVGTGWQGALQVLTQHRRALRAERPQPAGLPVIFNDYMNTLMGDPTTAKLLPLIDAAAAAGAEYFCIDAGWYDDSLEDWWDSVGEWKPSTVRFPGGGLGAVIDHIRAAGMVPGLWLEPEVMGVRSPMVDRLPESAFLQRDGHRVVEHSRFHLDLRSPEVRAHLDQVVDGLVRDFGIGYFKLDYNITAGPGTDLDAPSVGAGLLAHNRAHLTWLEGVLERHPGLVIENCASGAQRMDYAMLTRLHLQSTTDQQEALLYPPVAAAAPASLLPEQAGNWAYPQTEMSDEEITFTLVTGMLGRLYLSGRLDLMTGAQLALVQEAVRTHQEIRDDLARSLPVWPLGLPVWDAPEVALALATDEVTYLTVWARGEDATEIALPLAHLAGRDVEVETLFPRASTWTTRWSREDGVLHVTPSAAPTARVLRVRHS